MSGEVPIPAITPTRAGILRFCRAAMVGGIVALVAGTSGAQQALAPAPSEYEIKEQALDAALDAYIRVSGAQVFYETALTTGLQSRVVKGSFTPDTALGILLAGTGLVVRRTAIDAFVITAAPTGQFETAALAMPPDRRFIAALQTGVLEALCRTPSTRPGGYKIAVEIWIAPTGAVQHSALIGSTGDPARDRLLVGALRRASIGMAPPANTPQPFVFTIGPHAPRETGDCAD